MADYLIPCLLGLEKLVGDEVKKLGLRDVHVENGASSAGGRNADSGAAEPAPALRARGCCWCWASSRP